MRCEICLKTFKDGDAMRSHLYIHAGMCVCELCGVWYRNSAELNSHMITSHQFGGFLCVICALLVPSNTSVQSHMESHKVNFTDKLPCHFCGVELLLPGMKIHLAERHSTATYCNICATKSVVDPRWKYHKCKCCSAMFCQEFYLDLHMLEKHNKKNLNKQTSAKQ